MNENIPLYHMNKHGVAWFKFDEPSGNVTDSKGAAIGTINGGVTRVTGWNGKGSALSFNGTTGYVSFSDKVIPTGEISIRMKLRSSVVPPDEARFILANAFESGDRGIRCLISTNGYLNFYYNTGSSTSTSSRVFSLFPHDGQWHDVLFVWNGTMETGAMKLYIDDMSTPIAEGTSAASNSTTGTFNLRLGAQPSTKEINRFYNGDIDDIEIYNQIIDPNPHVSVINVDEAYKTYYVDNWIELGSSLPSASAIKEKGIVGDLSALDRKSKVLSNASILNDTLDQGKIYKSTINLSEIIELKSITVD